MPSKLEIYQQVLKDEFKREWEFLAGVIAGHNAAKSGFTDQLIAIFNFGASNVIGNLPVPGSSVMSSVLELAIDWGRGQISDDPQQYIEQQRYENEIKTEQLNILLETVALKACQRYEFIITNYLSDIPTEAVIPFARAGIERMLEYVVRNRLPLSEENLLMGLIEGHSGAYVSGFKNTRLVAKIINNKKFTLTAEGIYGRSGFMTPDGQYWVLFGKDNALHKKQPNFAAKLSRWEKAKGFFRYKREALFNYGYVKIAKGTTQDPKYGYIQVPFRIKDHFGYKLQSPNDLSNAYLKSVLSTYRPTLQVAQRRDIENYLQKKTQYLSFIDFLKKTWQNPNIQQVLYQPELDSDRDFTAAHPSNKTWDFSGTNFTNCVLDGFKISGSINKAHFEHTSLIGADVTGVTSAEEANFTAAQLSYLKGEKSQLSGANFTRAKFSYAKLWGAKMQRVHTQGADLANADFDSVQMDNSQKSDQLRTEQEQQQKTLIEHDQQLKVLQTKIVAQDKTLLQLTGTMKILNENLASSITSNRNAPKDQVVHQLQDLLDQLAQEKAARETFTRYCTSQLQLLQQQGQAGQQQTIEHQKQIKILQTQLIQISQAQTQLPQLVDEITDLTQQMNKLSESKTQQAANTLQSKVSKYIQDQASQLSQLSIDLNNLRTELDELKQNLLEVKEKQNQQQRDHSQLAHRIDFMEKKAAVNSRHIYASPSAEEIFSQGYQYEKNKNFTKAMEYYQRAGDAGHPKAFTYLGALFLEHHRMTMSEDEQDIRAYECFLKGANQHKHPRAMYLLAYMIENGKGGVSVDLHVALSWYKQALDCAGAKDDKIKTNADYNIKKIEALGIGGLRISHH